MQNNPPQLQIETFVNDLIAQKASMHGLHPEIAQELKQDLTEQVIKAINMALINALPEVDALHCIDLLEAGKQQEVIQMIDTKVKNADEVTAIAMTQFKLAYLGKA